LGVVALAAITPLNGELARTGCRFFSEAGWLSLFVLSVAVPLAMFCLGLLGVMARTLLLF